MNVKPFVAASTAPKQIPLIVDTPGTQTQAWSGWSSTTYLKQIPPGTNDNIREPHETSDSVWTPFPK